MKLFTPFSLGPIPLTNRIVMAPMTRSRAVGGVPNQLMQHYYGARAAAGLIITEGIAPSPDGLGYARIPGLFSKEQVAGFSAITSAVHRKGGKIFAQLMHVGRIAHPLNMPEGARILAPSAVPAAGTMWTDQQGPQPHPTPRAMSAEDIRRSIDEFAEAARHARAAGFDGVELHAANGYLLNQFLHSAVNRREDEYGGSVENRARFLFEVAARAAEAFGKDRVGIRLSPYGTFNDLSDMPDTREQFVAVAGGLAGHAYLHVVQNPHPLFADTFAAMKAAFQGPIILNGGFSQASAEAAVTTERADLISFGRPFIANPDLVERFREGVELATPNPATFYTPGPEGYVDYPLHRAAPTPALSA